MKKSNIIIFDKTKLHIKNKFHNFSSNYVTEFEHKCQTRFAFITLYYDLYISFYGLCQIRNYVWIFSIYYLPLDEFESPAVQAILNS